MKRLGVLWLLSGSLVVAPVPARAEVRTVPPPRVVLAQDGAVIDAAPDLSDPVVLVPKVKGFVRDMTAAEDRFAYVEETTSADKVRSRVVLRDVSGRLVGAQYEQVQTANGGQELRHPAISPDGTRLVWTAASLDGASSLEATSYTNSPHYKVAGSDTGLGLRRAVFLDNTTLLVSDASGGLATLPVNGGQPRPVLGAVSPSSASFAVSTDRTQIAMYDGQRISVATLSRDSVGNAVLGEPVVVTETAEVGEGPTFDADGTALCWTAPGAGGAPDVFRAPTNGGLPTNLSQTDPIAEGAPAPIQRDAQPPAPVSTSPFILSGTTTYLAWTSSQEADLVGFQVRRWHNGSLERQSFESYPPFEYPLAIGETYEWEISAVDRSGNTSTPVTRKATALAVDATVLSPTSARASALPFRVSFSDKGSYDVAYRANYSGDLIPWITGGSGPSQVFSAGKAGSSYGFTLQVHDAFGNSSSGFQGDVKAYVPYDQDRAAFSSGVLMTNRDRWLGSAWALQRKGAKAVAYHVTSRILVIGERCTSCGAFDVYDGTTRLAGIDTHATTRSARQVIYQRALSGGEHTITIVARGSAGHPNVVLDGFVTH